MILNKFAQYRADKKIFLTFFPVAALAVSALTACGTVKNVPHNVSNWAGKVARPEAQMPTSCSGWQKIELKNHSRYLLMQKDQKLLLNIDAHNLRGRNMGCWT
ncbi:hypothetical protein [Candidatus Tokpelaia sp.]|uniref:hypothetical protein n=1 Tax=Candidatus Tokpelaia sp. TaxID=2233777 RepID=UPI001FEE219C|nr:hypothetical protein [Candidatus Tokpelaia sp.]